MLFAKRTATIYATARAEVRAEYERILAVLREELATKERQLDAAIERADLAADRLLAVYGARAISHVGREDYSEQVRSEAELSRVVNHDMFEDLPLGDPRGTYKSLDEADILATVKENGNA